MIPPLQHNQQVATIFRLMAERLATQRANPYRVRAYRKAADTIEALEEDIADIASRQALEDLEGIGKDLAEKIEEFLKTGTIQTYETLNKMVRQNGQVLQSYIYHSAPHIFYASTSAAAHRAG